MHYLFLAKNENDDENYCYYDLVASGNRKKLIDDHWHVVTKDGRYLEPVNSNAAAQADGSSQ